MPSSIIARRRCGCSSTACNDYGVLQVFAWNFRGRMSVGRTLVNFCSSIPWASKQAKQMRIYMPATCTVNVFADSCWFTEISSSALKKGPKFGDHFWAKQAWTNLGAPQVQALLAFFKPFNVFRNVLMAVMMMTMTMMMVMVMTKVIRMTALKMIMRKMVMILGMIMMTISYCYNHHGNTHMHLYYYQYHLHCHHYHHQYHHCGGRVGCMRMRRRLD